MPRLFTNQTLQAGCDITLENTASHHLAHVMRARAGDSIVLFNGDGYNYAGTIMAAGKHSTVAIQSSVENHCESPLKIHLVQGVSRSDKMDYCLQKSVELGVSTIHAVFTRKSLVKAQKDRVEKKLRHWQAVVTSACEQSGRSVVPKLFVYLNLQEALADAGSNINAAGFTLGSKMLLHPATDKALAKEPISHANCTLIIGAESGLHEEEVELAQQNGFSAVALGPRILRTESAAPAAISILQSLHGDLG